MARKIVDETLKFNIVVNGDPARKEYGQLERQKRKLVEANKDLEKQAKKLEKANDTTSDSYKALKAEIEKNNKTIKENEQRMGELTEELGITNLTTRELTKEMKRLRGIMSNLDPETEEWAAYNKQLKSVVGRLANLREEMKPIEASMDDQLETLGQLSAGFGQFFSALRSGDYKAAAQGLDTIKKGINGATAAALKFVATPLGATIAVLAGIGFAAKEWFNYNREARESIELTQQITKLQGEQANAVRLHAQVLHETYGVDIKETLETARNLSRQFNISFIQALDEIEAGLIRGQRNNAEYFDSLREYPTFFASMQFSAAEFRKVIETGYDLGIYSDKLPDALKEVDLSLREQTKSTKEALINAYGAAFSDDILSRIKKGELSIKNALGEIAAETEKNGLNIQQNAQLTADVFRGAGEDVGGAMEIFRALNIVLNQQEEALTPLEQRLNEITQAYKEEAKAQDEALKSDNYVALATDLELFWVKVKTLFFQGVKFVTDQFSFWNERVTSFFFQFVTVVQAMPEIAKISFAKLKQEVWEVIKTFNGLSEVGSNLLSFNFDKAKEAFQEFKEDFKKEASDVAGVAQDTVKIISDIRKSVDDSVRAEFDKKRQAAAQQSQVNGLNRPSGSGSFNPDNGNELTPEDKKKIDSRKRLFELLDQMDQERTIQEQLKKITKDRRAEEEEILRIETKFAKLQEQAAGETELLARLEEEKLAQIQDVRDKYSELRAEKEKSAQEKELERQKELNDRLIEGEQQLNQARENAKQVGLGILRNFFGEASVLGKIFFALQKGLAISDIVKNSKAAIAAALSNEGKIPAFIPTPAGFAIPNPTKPLSAAATLKQISAIKTAAAANIGAILAETVEGFEKGLYPVKRQGDGRVFKARFGGDPSTQIVTAPTHFIAGESKPEMIIDGDTFRRMDPAITRHILALAGKPVQGFESGAYPGAATLDPTIMALNENLSLLNKRLQDPLFAQVLYGPEQSRKQQEYDKKIKSIRQKAKIRRNGV